MRVEYRASESGSAGALRARRGNESVTGMVDEGYGGEETSGAQFLLYVGSKDIMYKSAVVSRRLWNFRGMEKPVLRQS